jgi:4-aminobutyrate aminotransferase-like enzyme
MPEKGVAVHYPGKDTHFFPPLTMRQAIAEEGLEILESCL